MREPDFLLKQIRELDFPFKRLRGPESPALKNLRESLFGHKEKATPHDAAFTISMKLYEGVGCEITGVIAQLVRYCSDANTNNAPDFFEKQSLMSKPVML